MENPAQNHSRPKKVLSLPDPDSDASHRYKTIGDTRNDRQQARTIPFAVAMRSLGAHSGPLFRCKR